SFYSDGTQLDAVLCSNDSTALGVENSLAAFYVGNYPVITGQDCDIANVKNIIAGNQSMSVFKDTRDLVIQTTEMCKAILEGKDVPINDNTTYDNGVKVVPSFLCRPIFVTADNYKEILIDSGYYKEDQLS
ncbi:MAG: substrate-binding domain-containing protein, partial [Clostridiales bacterium]|nr:substrate-binding domain-containing protein [Clostridiales bacterium]